MLLQKNSFMCGNWGKESLCELHLIGYARWAFSVVFEKLKTGIREISIQSAGDAESSITRINARHLFFGVGEIKLTQEALVSECARNQLLKGVGDCFSGGPDSFILRSRQNVGTQKRTGGPVAMQQPQLALFCRQVTNRSDPIVGSFKIRLSNDWTMGERGPGISDVNEAAALLIPTPAVFFSCKMYTA